MSGDEGDTRHPSRRGREAHAEEVARAMRENLKKRKAKARARRERAGKDEPGTPEGEGDRALDG